ncbi:hypothetical protein BS17DRAFT_862920, partial [Gyrodon lividus]
MVRALIVHTLALEPLPKQVYQRFEGYLTNIVPSLLSTLTIATHAIIIPVTLLIFSDLSVFPFHLTSPTFLRSRFWSLWLQFF